MKSNRCLFNKAIFKSDLKRFLPFAIPLLIVDLIIFPIIIYSNFHLPNDPLTLEDFTGMSVAADIFSFMFSGAFALLVFSYLYKANRCNAIHAFPIGRKGLFVSSYLAGYILTVVPQLIAFAVSIPGIHIASKETAQILILQFVSIFAESFVFYTTAVLAVMLAGNIFAGAVLYLIINFFTFMFEAVVNLVLGRIGYGLSASESFSFGIFSFSPLAEFIACKVALAFNSQDIVPTTLIENTLLELWSAYYPRIAVLCGVSVVLIIVAYLLYKIRKLECAGDMVAFRIEIPIISLIVAFFGGSLMSMFVSIFVPFKLVGFIASFVVFSFVCFIIAQMVLRKTPKIFNFKNIILWAVFCAVTVASLYALSVYKTNYIPNANKVKQVTVTSSYQMVIEDKEDIALVEKFHKALIENAKQKKVKTDEENSGLSGWLDSELFYNYDYMVTFLYSLNGEKQVLRTYSFDKENKELVEMLSKLEDKHHPESVFDKLEGMNYKITSVSVSIWGSFEDDSVASPEIPKSRYNEFFDVCKAQHAKALETYRTEPNNFDEEISDGDENSTDAETYYDVTFSCRVTDEQSKKMLNDIEDYYYDQLSARIEKVTEYEESGWRIKSDTESFDITISDISSETDFYKIISSFDASKKAA